MQFQNITSREREVLELVAHEYTTPEIASRLYLSKHTIDSHKKNIKDKLAVKNSAGMVRRGFELGLLKIVSSSAAQILLLIMVMTLASLSVNAQTEIELRTDGIVVPRTTTGAVLNPVEGQLIYDTAAHSFLYYDGLAWQSIGSGGSGPFERVGALVRQSSPTDESDDWLFGRQVVPQIGLSIQDSLLFFDQSLGAFRGGLVGGFPFDTIGTMSFAYGERSVAKGKSSVALGGFTNARGDYSTALGMSSSANGDYSIASGFLALASGEYATAFGRNTKALGLGSVSLGSFTEASAFASTAFGIRTIASEWGATAFGRESVASGRYSTAFGEETIALGENSTAFGDGTTASGIRSVSWGSNSQALGDNSTAFGGGVTSISSGGIALGDYSTAFGRGTKAVGRNSTAFGLTNVANAINCTVVGEYNDSLVVAGYDGADRPLFIVGTGNVPVRQNGLVVRRNGEVSFQDYTFPKDDGSTGQVMTTDGSGQLAWTTISDGDSDDTNELQDLSLTSNTLSITDGNSVSLTPYLDNTDDWSNTGSNIHFTSGAVGLGTSSPDATLHIEAPSSRTDPLLTLQHDGTTFVRQAYANNLSDEEKWYILAQPQQANNTSNAFFRIFYTDTDGVANWETDPGINVFDLEAKGDATLAGSLTENSDVRLKKDITPISDVLSTLSQMSGYRYQWKNRANEDAQIGLIAQEVQAIYPELINENEEGILSVSYTKMVPVLLEAIKEQQEMIKGLEKRISQMEER